MWLARLAKRSDLLLLSASPSAVVRRLSKQGESVVCDFQTEPELAAQLARLFKCRRSAAAVSLNGLVSSFRLASFLLLNYMHACKCYLILHTVQRSPYGFEVVCGFSFLHLVLFILIS